MTKAAVSELKATLSKYLAKVKAGEEVIITERGHAIARLVRYNRSGPSPADLEMMYKSGIMRRPLKPWSGELLKPSPVKDPEGLVLKALLEERETGW